MIEYEIGPMQPEERKQLEAMKDDKFVREFVGVWNSWKGWENYNPVVAARVDTCEVLGFNAHIISKVGYINVVYTWVHPDHREVGLATDMLDYTLFEGLNRGASRLKLRSAKDGNSFYFWSFCGLVPIAESDKEYFYDLSLDGITDIHSLKELGSVGATSVTPDKRTLNAYLKLNKLGIEGLMFTHPAWTHLNEVNNGK